jgi:hypothetical protein
MEASASPEGVFKPWCKTLLCHVGMGSLGKRERWIAKQQQDVARTFYLYMRSYITPARPIQEKFLRQVVPRRLNGMLRTIRPLGTQPGSVKSD